MLIYYLNHYNIKYEYGYGYEYRLEIGSRMAYCYACISYYVDFIMNVAVFEISILNDDAGI